MEAEQQLGGRQSEDETYHPLMTWAYRNHWVQCRKDRGRHLCPQCFIAGRKWDLKGPIKRDEILAKIRFLLEQPSQTIPRHEIQNIIDKAGTDEERERALRCQDCVRDAFDGYWLEDGKCPVCKKDNLPEEIEECP
jgi:rubrerythrin